MKPESRVIHPLAEVEELSFFVEVGSVAGSEAIHNQPAIPIQQLGNTALTITTGDYAESRLIKSGAEQEHQPKLSASSTLEEKLEAAKNAILLPYYEDDMKSYLLATTHRVPLLNAEEEVEIGKRIEAGLMAEYKLNAAQSERKASKAAMQQRAQLRQVQNEGLDAQQLLLLANQRLVVSIAKKYRKATHMRQLDLVQEGNLGLVRAMQMFDYTKGYKFSTYATWWIRQAIGRSLDDQENTIRIPVHMGERLRKFSRIEDGLKQDLGRDPTVKELCLETGKEPDEVQELRRTRSLQPRSFEEPVIPGSEVVLAERIAANPNDTTAIDAVIEERATHDQVQRLMSGLNAREYNVISLIYKLSGETATIGQLAKAYGVTEERIRQIKRSATSKMLREATALGIQSVFTDE